MCSLILLYTLRNIHPWMQTAGVPLLYLKPFHCQGTRSRQIFYTFRKMKAFDERNIIRDNRAFIPCNRTISRGTRQNLLFSPYDKVWDPLKAFADDKLKTVHSVKFRLDITEKKKSSLLAFSPPPPPLFVFKGILRQYCKGPYSVPNDKILDWF